MKTKTFSLIIALMFLLMSIYAQNNKAYKQSVIRIKITENAVKSLQSVYGLKSNTTNSIKPTKQSYVTTGLNSLDIANKKYNAKEYKRVFRYAGKFEEKHRAYGLHRWYEITLNTKASVEEMIEAYKSLTEVTSSEGIPESKLFNEPNKSDEKISGTNDPGFSKQWHYENTGQNGGTPGSDISLLEAWEIETGNSNVIVAVEDGGIAIDHNDLSGNIWVNPGETPGNGIDDDNNGFIDDIHGYNFVNNTGTIQPHSHGTHVAGTIAAETNNGTGVSGIAGGSGNSDGVRLMSCQVFTSASNGGFAEAYVYAADNGAVISQNSWGHTQEGAFAQSILDAMDYFAENAGGSNAAMDGGLVIFAAGNSGKDGEWYPGYYETALAVASTSNQDKKAYYSNYGTWVELSAPGGDQSIGPSGGVYSTALNNSYAYMQGTSMACPHVSGVAALVVSKFYGNITPQQLWNKLVDNTDPIDNLNSSYTGKLGSGRLNAYKALNSGGGDTEAPTAPSNITASSITQTSLNLSWDESTDNVGVDHYAIFQDGNEIGITTNTNYSVSGLTAETTYSYTLKAYDAAGNTSNTSNTKTVTTLPEVGEYCASSSNIYSEEWIANVQIDGQNYPSENSAYSDFTSTIIDFSVPGDKNIILTPGYARNPYTEYFVIWIDFNKDGDFEDAGEEVFAQEGNTAVSGIISIPSSLTGQTRMRISMKYNVAPTACENFQYGEVEDYTVIFEENQGDTEAPTTPENLTSSNIAQTTVDLSWDASDDNVGVDHYVIYKDGIQAGTSNTTSYNVRELVASTTYSFTVKAFDAAGNASVASNEETITTLPENNIEYCSSKGNNSYYFWIEYAGLNGMENTSGNDNGYGDYTSKIANIGLGNTERLYLQAAYNNYTYTVYWTVWIDFNKNGDFESSELIIDGSSAQTEQLYADFDVPTTALTGQTRMRISMKYGSAAGSCESFSFGEVEDYTVNITSSGTNTFSNKTSSNAIELGDEIINDIIISPNPAQDILRMEFRNIPQSVVNILSSNGALVKTIHVNKKIANVNISDIAKGVYHIQFNNGISEESRKFIKQ